MIGRDYENVSHETELLRKLMGFCMLRPNQTCVIVVTGGIHAGLDREKSATTGHNSLWEMMR